jgi:hypothetical protein
MPELILPGAEDRTVVIGPTGSGKTVAGAWLLSRQRFDKRPWVALDFKNEILWDQVGSPTMRHLKLGHMPDKRGLYRMPVDPGDEEALEQWFWKVWRAENIGLFIDELSLVPQCASFRAILRQGRSKRIPLIGCTQRPVKVDREVFSESGFKMIFPLSDGRDSKTVKEFCRDAPIDKPIRNQNGVIIKHASYWYDEKRDALLTLQPTPKPEIIAAELRRVVPVRTFWGT